VAHVISLKKIGAEGEVASGTNDRVLELGFLNNFYILRRLKKMPVKGGRPNAALKRAFLPVQGGSTKRFFQLELFALC